MSLQLGQEKSLCVPPTVPMNLGTGKKTEPADPKRWGLQTDSKQMRNHSCYQQFPACNLGKMSNKLELQTKCQQFPLWSLGTNQPLSFSTQVRELWSEQRARGLGSGWTHLLAQAELPWIGTPITLRGWHRVELRTERNLSVALGNSKRQRTQKGLQGPCLFLIVSEAIRGLLQSYCWQ